MAQLAEATTLQTLNTSMHRRKWNLVLHGIEGPINEEERQTREKCLKFAKEELKVKDANATRIAACHRLSSKENAGIIIRFCDLSQRDRWLSGTKHLKGKSRKVSLSPDLPPPLRPLKDELMLKRRDLEPAVKSKSRVRYLRSWPFVDLKIENRDTVRPSTELRQIVKNVLGVDPIFEIVESTDPAGTEPPVS